jgi:hypothetical protein
MMEKSTCEKTLKELGVKNNDIFVLRFRVKGGAPPLCKW